MNSLRIAAGSAASCYGCSVEHGCRDLVFTWDEREAEKNNPAGERARLPPRENRFHGRLRAALELGVRATLTLGAMTLSNACSGNSDADRKAPEDAQAEKDSAMWGFDAGFWDADGSLLDTSFVPCGGEIQSGCAWTVPLGSDGKAADLNKISIRLRDATGHETPLSRVAGPGACVGDSQAWYVDTPYGAGSVLLIACPATCDLINATGQDVVLLPGCVDPQP
ncbi:MAG TPA: hypothetical protein PKD61_15730 [Polyangiaceae bacterium]|nr:hypothetical protein [Polyangiaceae bacterium]